MSILMISPRVSASLVLVATLASAATVSAAAQTMPPSPGVSPVISALPQSQLEILLATPDALMVQDLYRVSDNITATLGVTVDALLLSEKTPGVINQRGIRLVLRDDKKPDYSTTSYIDLTEVATLSQALAEMSTIAGQWTRDGARAMEAEFKTVGGFTVAIRQDSQNQRATLTSGFIDPAHHSLNIADLTTLKAAIDQALALLQSK